MIKKQPTGWTRRGVLAALLAGSAGSAAGQNARFGIAPATRQLILGRAPDWNASTVTLQRFVRSGRGWLPVGAAWSGRLGASGLVWGRGLHTPPAGARLKVEGDRRAPAGAFAIGGAYGYAGAIRRHPQLAYRRITPGDLWVEDVASPHYNKHLVIPTAPRTAWEKKQQMKQDDPAHSLKLFIAHNAAPRIVPNGGSSIFFHIWRSGGGRASSGCTTMSEPALKEMIAWIDPTALPVYVLLPESEYQRLRGPWGLP